MDSTTVTIHQSQSAHKIIECRLSNSQMEQTISEAKRTYAPGKSSDAKPSSSSENPIVHATLPLSSSPHLASVSTLSGQPLRGHQQNLTAHYSDSWIGSLIARRGFGRINPNHNMHIHFSHKLFLRGVNLHAPVITVPTTPFLRQCVRVGFRSGRSSRPAMDPAIEF